MKTSKIPEILAAVAPLLRKANEPDWARACERLADQFGDDPVGATRAILAMFGGMGSFNDLVLYERGEILVAENDELDRLRTQLHVECRKEL